MNRIIKFRYWNETFKTWEQSDYMVGKDGFLKMRTDCIPCQFTGLHDKNGKEIYEGDIVTGGVYYGWKNESGKGVVRFGEWGQDASGQEYGPANCLGFYIEILECEFGYSGGASLMDEKEKHKNIEIIGNIYESPELLK